MSNCLSSIVVRTSWSEFDDSYHQPIWRNFSLLWTGLERRRRRSVVNALIDLVFAWPAGQSRSLGYDWMSGNKGRPPDTKWTTLASAEQRNCFSKCMRRLRGGTVGWSCYSGTWKQVTHTCDYGALLSDCAASEWCVINSIHICNGQSPRSKIPSFVKHAGCSWSFTT